jgi:hypothetical protein
MSHDFVPQDQILWQLPLKNIKSCQQDMSVDVAIIGGGMAGLSVAYELSKRGIKAILLEQTYCGAGATGKSSGFVTSNAELSLSDLLKRYPEKTAYDIWGLFNQGLESIRSRIQEHKLVCDYQQQDTLILARTVNDLKTLKKEYDVLKSTGDSAIFYTKEQLEAIICSKNYYGAVCYKNSFGINGYAYCQELKRIIEQQGIEVFEETPALSIDGPHDWNADKPTKDEISKYLNTHDMAEYGLWFLGNNTQAPVADKEHYCFVIGDLKMVYEIALERAAQAAAQEGLVDIARAAQSLIEYIQEKKNC